jgi:aspartate racemase
MQALPHVVIVGGGFAGLWATRGLAGAPMRITVIDRGNHHLFQPLLYQVAGALGRRGIAWAVPSPEDQKLVNEVIFDELCLGTVKDESRDAYVRIIDELEGEGCDAVALVCTEIPLLVTPEVSPLPTLDSTRLLAKAAVEVAIGERPMPAWRGGPLS